MDDRTTRLVSEELARALDRRTFIKRISQTLFIGVATVAAGHGLSRPARANQDGLQPAYQVPNCVPPGPYCNYEGVNPRQPDSCHGAHCFEHLYQGQVITCRIDVQYYQVGCWTTAGNGGYWTCCDCVCGDPQVTTCGCAQFSVNPSPEPDRPGIGTTA